MEMQTFVSPITIPLAEDLDPRRVSVDQGRRGRITVGELIVSFSALILPRYVENIARMLKITIIKIASYHVLFD